MQLTTCRAMYVTEWTNKNIKRSNESSRDNRECRKEKRKKHGLVQEIRQLSPPHIAIEHRVNEHKRELEYLLQTATAMTSQMATTKAEITRKSFATKIYYRRLNRTSVHISNASNQHTIITPLTSEPFSLLTSFIRFIHCGLSMQFLCSLCFFV